MRLTDPIETLSGIGEKTAKILNKASIFSVYDFLYNLPRSYENYTAVTKISDLHPGKVIIRGKIDSLSTRRSGRRNLAITEGIIRDQTGAIRVIWFNQAYRARQFSPDKEYIFTGLYDFKAGRYSLQSPSAIEAKDADYSGGLTPVYSAHGRLSSTDFRRLMNKSRSVFSDIPDLLPTVPKNYRKDALFNVHFPSTESVAKKARDYLAYEELFALILASKLNQDENAKLTAKNIPFCAKKIRDFVGSLPFKLTNAQRRAAYEIFLDMNKSTPMNRLLQGDVGSGKTMVAAMAAHEAILGGGQVALLAPTAVLATQHYAGLKKYIKNSALLTGATKKKPELKQKIKNGEIDLIIGTHALLTDDTEFKDLSLVIIDEQHRFGVEQRQKLLLKSPSHLAPHLLSMTATPIPRSLQLTVFGDLDVSILNEMPRGRQPITTKILKEVETREILYPKLLDTIDSGHQAYWICRAIDDNPRSETASVKSRFDKLTKLFPKLKIALLHGRMKPAEKDQIMTDFSAGKIDLLISTTVVEVGVDVPNATLIIIEDAENYGLAQLHQLRGRVGRGSSASDCFLLTRGDDEPSRRLRELERSTDGFHLAEVDLKMRGPGEIYGALQHGALDLRIATLTDTHLIQRARTDVNKFLQNPENMVKYKELMSGIKKYQQLTTLN